VRKAGAEVLPSVPWSAEARLRLRCVREGESEPEPEPEPWSESSPSSDVSCLVLVLEDAGVASFLEGEGADLDFSLRAYLKKSRASGSSPFPLFTGLTPFAVEGVPCYTNRLTDELLTNLRTDGK